MMYTKTAVRQAVYAAICSDLEECVQTAVQADQRKSSCMAFVQYVLSANSGNYMLDEWDWTVI